MCKRNGWEVGRVFEENDVSAYSGKKRPQYRAMMDAVDRRDVGAIVAYHPDRLHRSPVELEDFIERVNAAKTKIATVAAGEYDLSTSAGRMSARIVGAVARAESERQAERTRGKKDQLAEHGMFAGAPLPSRVRTDRPGRVRQARRTLRRDRARLRRVIREAPRVPRTSNRSRGKAPAFSPTTRPRSAQRAPSTN